MTARSCALIYVLDRFPADTLNFVYNEIRELELAGHRVEIYSILPGGNCPREAQDFLGRTRNVRPVGPIRLIQAWLFYLARNPIKLLSLVFNLLFDNRTRRWIKGARSLGHLIYAVYFAWLMRDRREHVHAHFAFKAATAALVASRLNRSTFSFTAHGSATVYPPARYHIRSKVRAASFVIAVSDYNRGVMLSLCPEISPERIVVNRTGILLDQFPLRDPLEPSNDGMKILCIASLYPVKNHECLLRAAGLLRRRGVRLRLDLVGKDADGRAEKLRVIAREEGVADLVVFHGIVDHDLIRVHLASSDVCVLTSYSEGVPVSLMEAMASGVPVIGPRVTGVPELIEDGKTGLLIDPHDPTSVAHALELMASDSDLGRVLSEAARTHVAQYYDMRKNAALLAGIISERLCTSEGVGRGR